METGDHGPVPRILDRGRTAVLKRCVPYRTRGDGCDMYEESVKFGFFVLADSTENVRNTAIYSNPTHMSAEGEKG